MILSIIKVLSISNILKDYTLSMLLFKHSLFILVNLTFKKFSWAQAPI